MPVDIDVLRYRISDVRASISEITRLISKPFTELAIDERYSMRYNIIVTVESIVSLATHIAVEDYGYTPKSYTDAVTFICNKLGIKCFSDLIALIRLRNILVHRYWNVNDSKVYTSAKKNFKCLKELIRLVEKRYGID